MLNLNIGILGHVDSGKTSLAKALSTTASTAAFDKSPQSQSRGITLDLGFSAREVTPEVPGCAPLLAAGGLERLPCTLVDCPGHASLIRTVVGGAHIIDVMVLVIDATKGVQAQTAECIVLGEVLARPLVVALNKVDAVQGATEAERAAALQKLRRRLTATFAQTRWPTVTMVEMSAAPRDGGAAVGTEALWPAVLSLLDLSELRAARARATETSGLRDFLMMVDHCFAVKGQGTVLTGTVLRGVARVGDAVLLPELRETRKVRSMQVFRRAVEAVREGDRAGLCVTQLDPDTMERGMICGAPTDGAAAVRETSVLVARLHRVRFHTLPCDSHTKYHINVGHATVMGTLRYFRRPASTTDVAGRDADFDVGVESECLDELDEEAFLSFTGESRGPGQPAAAKEGSWHHYAVVLLESPVHVAARATFVAMRLDLQRENVCRIAMVGAVVALLDGTAPDGSTPLWRSLPVVRRKTRALRVDRVVDERTCIVTDVVVDPSVSKDVLHAEVQKFIGLQVEFRATEAANSGTAADAAHTPAVVEGVLDSAFGKTGKAKAVFRKPIFTVGPKTKNAAPGSTGGPFLVPGEIQLSIKKYPWAPHSSLQQ